MIRSPPRCTRTGRLCPSPALSRSYAGQKVPAPHVFARRSGEVRCVAEPPFIFDANIGCEFANELVTEPKACFDRRQDGPNSDFRDILSGQVELDPRLQDQPLRDALVIIRFYARGAITLDRKSVVAGK